jgi:hypothetical protein
MKMVSRTIPILDQVLHAMADAEKALSVVARCAPPSKSEIAGPEMEDADRDRVSSSRIGVWKSQV